jgi:hypothetical protein
MRQTISVLSILLFLLGTAYDGNAQAKPSAKPTVSKILLKTIWGNFLGDSLPASKIMELVDSSLHALDQNKRFYQIESFKFLYEEKEPYLNEKGQVAFYVDAIGDQFKGDSLPTIWRNRIKETLKPGDVLYFNNIIVQLKGSTERYLAPALTFYVK